MERGFEAALQGGKVVFGFWLLWAASCGFYKQQNREKKPTIVLPGHILTLNCHSITQTNQCRCFTNKIPQSGFLHFRNKEVISILTGEWCTRFFFPLSWQSQNNMLKPSSTMWRHSYRWRKSACTEDTVTAATAFACCCSCCCRCCCSEGCQERWKTTDSTDSSQ